MATLDAHVDPAQEGLSAGVTASRGGEGARQLMRALAAGTVADLRQRARRTSPWKSTYEIVPQIYVMITFPLKCNLPILLTVVTYDVAEMVPALEFPAAFVFALPHWVGASEFGIGEICLSHQAMLFNKVIFSHTCAPSGDDDTCRAAR